MRPTAAELAATLGLEPHPEGGFFRQTYRAAETVVTPRGERAASTAILFLVTATALSHLHRIKSDELWVFQGGLPLELVTLSPDGELETRVLGDPADGMRGAVGAEATPPSLQGLPVTSCVRHAGQVRDMTRTRHPPGGQRSFEARTRAAGTHVLVSTSGSRWGAEKRAEGGRCRRIQKVI